MREANVTYMLGHLKALMISNTLTPVLLTLLSAYLCSLFIQNLYRITPMTLTLCLTVRIHTLQEGAREVYACTSHPVFSPPAIDRLSSGVFEEVIVTNTIPVNGEKAQCEKIRVLSVAELLAKAINSVHAETSVSVLFV